MLLYKELLPSGVKDRFPDISLYLANCNLVEMELTDLRDTIYFDIIITIQKGSIYIDRILEKDKRFKLHFHINEVHNISGFGKIVEGNQSTFYLTKQSDRIVTTITSSDFHIRIEGGKPWIGSFSRL